MKSLLILLFACFHTASSSANEYILFEEKLRGVGTKWKSTMTVECDDITTKVLPEDEHSTYTVSINSQRVLEEVEILSPSMVRTTMLSKKDVTVWGKGTEEEVIENKESTLIGVPKTFEYRFGKWNLRPNKQDWTVDQLNEIKDSMAVFNAQQGFYGTAKRSVGDRWSVQARDWYGSISDWKEVSGKVNVTFLRIEEYQGRKCAVLSVQGELKGLMLDNDMKTQMKGEETIYRDLTYLSDMYVKSETKWESRGTYEEQEIEISFSVTSESQFEHLKN